MSGGINAQVGEEARRSFTVLCIWVYPVPPQSFLLSAALRLSGASINPQVTLDDGSIFHSPLPMPDQDAACEVGQFRTQTSSHFYSRLQLAAKLALESLRKEVENSSRVAREGQGVHGGGKQAGRGRGRGRRRAEQVSRHASLLEFSSFKDIICYILC